MNTTVQLLKISEAAKALNVSLETLRRWEKAGKIKTTRTPGGTRLYSTREINRLLKSSQENKIFVSDKKDPVSKRTLYRWTKEGIIPKAQKQYLDSVVSHPIEMRYSLSHKVKFRLGVLTVILLSLLSIYPLVSLKALNNISIDIASYRSDSHLADNQLIALQQEHQVESKKLDIRAQILKDYLAQFNSPLQYHTQDLVEAADHNAVDWKLLAAIAGAESTFGKRVPGGIDPTFSSFNGWGWGVYGDNVIYFDSWRDALFDVSKGLKKGYIDKGLSDPDTMNAKYSSSPFWADNVTYFLKDLDNFAKKYKS